MNPPKTTDRQIGMVDFLRAEARRCPTICATDYPDRAKATSLINHLFHRGELEIVAPCVEGSNGAPAIYRLKRL